MDLLMQYLIPKFTDIFSFFSYLELDTPAPARTRPLQNSVKQEQHTASKSDSSDGEAEDDYFGDNAASSSFTHPFQNDIDQLSVNQLKKRKSNGGTAIRNSVENSSADYGDFSNGSTSETRGHFNLDRRKRAKKPVDADEKWWIAQYALYTKLNKAQKFEMKKTISELQLKFEFQNLQNDETEIELKADQHSGDDSPSDDDPLQVNSLW